MQKLVEIWFVWINSNTKPKDKNIFKCIISLNWHLIILLEISRQTAFFSRLVSGNVNSTFRLFWSRVPMVNFAARKVQSIRLKFFPQNCRVNYSERIRNYGIIMINSSYNCFTVQWNVRNVKKIPFAALKIWEEDWLVRIFKFIAWESRENICVTKI